MRKVRTYTIPNTHAITVPRIYKPPFFRRTTDNGTAYLPTRLDINLMGYRPPGPNWLEVELRTYDEWTRQIKEADQLANPDPNKGRSAKSQQARALSGVSFRSPFYHLRATRATFPYNLPNDDLHTSYENGTTHVLDAFMGKLVTLLGNEVVPAADLRLASTLVYESRRLSPTSISGAIRVPDAKWGDFKAHELRSFVLATVLPMFHGIVEARVYKVLVTLVRMLQATEMTSFDAVSVNINPAFWAYESHPSGRRTVSVATVDWLVYKFLTTREDVFVGQMAQFAHLCTPTMHRLVHLGMWCGQWGPLWTTSTWGCEGKLGDLKQMAKSPVRPIQEVQNKELLSSLFLDIGNRYDLSHIRSPEVSGPSVAWSISHPQLPGILLCHPSKDWEDASHHLPADERAVLDAYLMEHAMVVTGGIAKKDKASRPRRYGRCLLASGILMRSSFREDGARFFKQGWSADRSSKKTAKDKGQSARFGLAWTPEQTTICVEVLSYVKLPIVGLTSPRFLAIVAESPPLHDRYGAYAAFDRTGEWRMRVLGVECLQTAVGIVKENAANRAPDDGWCAVQRGHDLSVTPFQVIERWE